MPTRHGIALSIAMIALPASLGAQEPLTAIDWLGQNAPQIRSGPTLGGQTLREPPVTQTALQPEIAVETLQPQPQPMGLVPSDVTGLPVNLWQGSELPTLRYLIDTVPVDGNPAMQTLLYTLLLSETRAPGGEDAQDWLMRARLDRLMSLGATDPLESLAESAGAAQNPALFQRWFDATLLNGTEDKACAALALDARLTRDYRARIFCLARQGDWQTAALILEAAHAIQAMPQAELDLMDRFLSPEIYDGAPHLPMPDDPDPLTFRLFEAIGERLPTASLPRAFANADLRDVSGWKAQIEAAERLTRIGALQPNRLLGLYTERRAAASGGVWDRVTALRRFETALEQNSIDAVTKTLPPVWTAMQEVGLEVAFAELFAPQISGLDFTDARAAQIAWRMGLLSSNYESVANSVAAETDTDAFLVALTRGTPGDVTAPNQMTQAISDGFSNAVDLPGRIQNALDRGALGETILLASEHFDRGATGNPNDLAAAIATLRRVGLEDTARRASLQLLLLGHG